MTFSMPAYALTIDTDKTVNEAVTNGLQVNSEVTATINGNVSDKTEGGGKIVEIDRESKVTINGDVNTNIENRQGDLTVSGNVEAKVDDADDSYYDGVSTRNGSTTIGKDVKVETKKQGNAVNVMSTPQGDTTGNANVSVGGDISIKSSGNTYVEEYPDDYEDDENDDAPDDIYFRDPLGLRYSLSYLADRYHLPMMIVENGLGAYDKKEEDGSVNDDYRIAYLRNHIEAMRDAVNEEGVDLLGYQMWAPIDIVSASTGEMDKRYGFIYVNKNERW